MRFKSISESSRISSTHLLSADSHLYFPLPEAIWIWNLFSRFVLKFVVPPCYRRACSLSYTCGMLFGRPCGDDITRSTSSCCGHGNGATACPGKTRTTRTQAERTSCRSRKDWSDVDVVDIDKLEDGFPVSVLELYLCAACSCRCLRFILDFLFWNQ